MGLAISGCGFESNTDDVNDSHDSMIVAPVFSSEDGIALDAYRACQSPISAEELLALPKVHMFESWLYHYDNPDDHADLWDAQSDLEFHRDSCAVDMANRFMRMYEVASETGDAMDMLQWAIAVNAVFDTFRVEVPEVPQDSTLDEIGRIMDKYTSWTQYEMNIMSYVYATMEYYHIFEAYRLWLGELPENLRRLAQEEFESWYQLTEARFAFWRDVSYNQAWYSMKPMEYQHYHSLLAENRLAELSIEHDIVFEGKTYHQLGETVTTKQWEDWLLENSVPDNEDFIEPDYVPDDSIVEDRKGAVREAFSRWLSARQAIAKALPKSQGISYDCLTADIHSRIVGKLEWLMPFEGY